MSFDLDTFRLMFLRNKSNVARQQQNHFAKN